MLLACGLAGFRRVRSLTTVFIGGGNMASALAGGMIANGARAQDLVVVEPVAAARDRLAQRLPGVRVVEAVSGPALEGARLVVLAVKPQQMREACAALAPHSASIPVVLSIAAGTRIADIATWLGGGVPVARAMPNTPAMVRAGISGVYAPSAIDEASRAAIQAVLDAAGESLWCETEATLDAVTGVSGSGPAYLFYCLESLEAGARAVGFDAADARKLAYATFDGAMRLARASEADPATLRAQVTSKGGTTERGIAALESRGVKEAFVEAVRAATARARELGDAPAAPSRPA
jgi:pyrroline-5-carboxylate reductase